MKFTIFSTVRNFFDGFTGTVVVGETCFRKVFTEAHHIDYVLVARRDCRTIGEDIDFIDDVAASIDEDLMPW